MRAGADAGAALGVRARPKAAAGGRAQRAAQQPAQRGHWTPGCCSQRTGVTLLQRCMRYACSPWIACKSTNASIRAGDLDSCLCVEAVHVLQEKLDAEQQEAAAARQEAASLQEQLAAEQQASHSASACLLQDRHDAQWHLGAMQASMTSSVITICENRPRCSHCFHC